MINSSGPGIPIMSIHPLQKCYGLWIKGRPHDSEGDTRSGRFHWIQCIRS